MMGYVILECYPPAAVENFASVEKLKAVVEKVASKIEELGGFGETHLDDTDCDSGQSSLLSLSFLQPNVHPGYMMLMSLGVGRRLDPFSQMYMCGLHAHAGTQPVFDEDKEGVPLDPMNIRILDIQYMTSSIMGTDGPAALCALAPGKVLELSREMRNPVRHFTHNDCLRTEHSTYAHDGVSSLPFDCLATYLGQDMLTLLVKTTVQTPKAMDMRVDRKAFLASISYVGEDGKRHSLEDWEYGPGHGPDGALHVEGSTAQFGNPKRDKLLAQITAHQALFRSSVPVCVIADKSSSMSSQREEYDNRCSRYNTLALRAKKGQPLLDSERGKGSKRSTDTMFEPKSSIRSGRISRKANISAIRISNRCRAEHPLAWKVQSRLRTQRKKPQRLAFVLLPTLNAVREAAAASPPAESSVAISSKAQGKKRALDAEAETTPEPDTSQVKGNKRRRVATYHDTDGESEIAETAFEAHAARAAQKFLENFSLNALSEVKDRATSTIDTVFKITTLTPDVGKLINLIDRNVIAVNCNPLSVVGALAVASSNSISAGAIRDMELQNVFHVLHRQRIMINASLGFFWLDDLLKPALADLVSYIIKAGIDKRPSPPAEIIAPLWLFELTMAIADCRFQQRKLKAVDFLPECSETSVIKPWMATPSELPGKLATLTVDVLMKWLKFTRTTGKKPSTMSDLGARFAKHLHVYAGTEALLLPQVWETFLRPDLSIARCGYARQTKWNELTEWQKLLENHPVSDPDSKERAMLKDIGAEYDRISQHPKMPAHEEVPTTLTPAPENLLSFITLAYRLLPAVEGAALTVPADVHGTPREILEFIMKDPDLLLPFRRAAPSLRSILKPNIGPSPFSKPHLRTARGLFSTAIFRTTLYRSPYVLNGSGKLLFDSAEDFLETVMPLPAKEYVLDNPYGGQPQPRAENIVKSTRQTWESANNPAVNQFLSASDYSYSAAVHDIVSKFAYAGPLGTHLIVSDYVDAGVVREPTPLEMGNQIAAMNAGGVAGLRDLDYFPSDNPFGPLVTEGFTNLYNYIDIRLSDEQKKRMHWGTVMLEHTLCKYSRVICQPRLAGYFNKTYTTRQIFAAIPS
ncbi:hypothetical protein B0H10DRAFT_2446446 [Mycena sp. CBHHK59/15]|nr:hypothetical protein B0H10DRAFT_2446446 [Mycena sp. CBHHK59/15]